MITTKDFIKHIKIGIMTKGFENWIEGDNLVITLGMLGKVTNSTTHKYKVDCEEIVNMFASQGIQMIKPVRFDPQRLAGLEWSVSQFLEEGNKIAIPQESLIYKDSKGKEHMRFNNYHNKSIPVESDNLSEESELEHVERVFSIREIDPRIRQVYPAELEMTQQEVDDLEIEWQAKRILDEDLELRIIEGAVWIYPIEQEVEFEEIEEEINPELEDLNKEKIKILERYLEDNRSEVSKNTSFFQKPIEAVEQNYYNENVIIEESTSSYRPHSYQPFSETMNIDSGGNIPPQKAQLPPNFQQWCNFPSPNITHKGKPYKPDQPIKLQPGEEAGKILNFLSFPPQQWPAVIDLWKSVVWAECVNKYRDFDTDDLYTVLETYLGQSAKMIREDFKKTHSKEYTDIKGKGANPWNFLNKVGDLITSQDPNIGSITAATDALIKLEQLTISDFRFINDFSNLFIYYAALAQHTFDPDILG